MSLCQRPSSAVMLPRTQSPSTTSAMCVPVNDSRAARVARLLCLYHLLGSILSQWTSRSSPSPTRALSAWTLESSSLRSEVYFALNKGLGSWALWRRRDCVHLAQAASSREATQAWYARASRLAYRNHRLSVVVDLPPHSNHNTRHHDHPVCSLLDPLRKQPRERKLMARCSSLRHHSVHLLYHNRPCQSSSQEDRSSSCHPVCRSHPHHTCHLL